MSAFRAEIGFRICSFCAAVRTKARGFYRFWFGNDCSTLSAEFRIRLNWRATFVADHKWLCTLRRLRISRRLRNGCRLRHEGRSLCCRPCRQIHRCSGRLFYAIRIRVDNLCVLVLKLLQSGNSVVLVWVRARKCFKDSLCRRDKPFFQDGRV